jgi:uncharacterized protein (TIGR02646 family)
MLLMNTLPLTAAAQKYLNKKQREIDRLDGYAKQVARGKQSWQSKSGDRFKEVRLVLTQMCVGSRRCIYCEDSVADEVEHIKPKDLYPGVVFVWDNYLYSCGPCNGPKNNFFAVFGNAGQVIEVSRKQADSVVPPETGADVFINPRAEDPTNFITLDLHTLLFIPKPRLSDMDKEKARYTIKILRLNFRDGDYLVDARKEAYHSYLDALQVYVLKKQQGADEAELLRRHKRLVDKSHPTVWFEIKRQRNRFAATKAFFAAAPELL